MPDEPLTLEQIGALARKTLDNSLALLDEAEGLLYLGHHARAFALGVLAAEEFGKHMMCHGAAAYAGRRPDVWEDFWRRFRNHQPKYENTVSMALQGVPPERRRELAEHFTAIVKTDQARKLAGLYVDVENGEAVSPKEVISEETAEGALYVFHELIRSWAAMWEGADWVEVFRSGLEGGGYEVAEALEKGDTEKVEQLFRTLRETRPGSQGEPDGTNVGGAAEGDSSGAGPAG